MLYVIGLILLLLSVGFVGGSVAVPVIIASVGIALMMVGKESANEKRTRI